MSIYSVQYPLTNPATPVNSDTDSLELGMAFQVAVPGNVTDVMFYRGNTTNAGPWTVKLWRVSTSALLASKVLASASASPAGWQVVTLDSPIAVSPSIEYLVSYGCPGGHYSNTGLAFNPPIVNGPLTGIVGRYNTTMGSMPTNSFNFSSYWVDLFFNDSAGGGGARPSSGQLWPRGNVSF